MKLLSVETAFTKIVAAAEAIQNDELARIGTVSLGDVVRQGDLYIVSIGGLPRTTRRLKSGQLAPGNSRGARHFLLGDFEIYEPDRDHVIALIARAIAPKSFQSYVPLIGPVFRTRGEVEVDHPEHGNRILPAGECFAVVYQRAFGVEVRPVLD